MIRLIRAGVLLLLLAATAHAQTTFPEDKDFFVNDYARLLDFSQEQQLRETLEELYDARGVEFTILTIDRMSDYGHRGEIEPFATALFNDWGIGDATRNDGVLMLIARRDRAMRIEVGSGYGNSLDAPMQRVIDRTILPRFREDNYDTGIIEGVDETIYQLTGRYPGRYDESNFRHFVSRSVEIIKTVATIGGIIGLFFLFPVAPFILIFFVYKFIKRYRRDRPRFCINDGTRMRRCIEETEDDKLSPGQLVEERLESVDYDVWYCNECDHVEVVAFPSWRSRFGACRECGFRTVQGTTRTIYSATYTSSGLQETDYTCEHCKAEYTIRRTIPKKETSTGSRSRSSRSRSSSRSRGGGRSSGGGASGRW